MESEIPPTTKTRCQRCARLSDYFRIAWCTLILLASTIPTAYSEEASPYPTFKVSGFGTLGLTKGGNEDLGFRRDVSRDGTFDGDWSIEPDSLLGLQVNASFNEKIAAALQIVGKERQDNSLKESVEWAYLRYRASQNVTIRLGRMGVDIYKLSDYRNIGFAYLWARPPIEFYAPLAFNYFEGIDFAYTKILDSGTFSAKLSLGTAENNFDFTGGSGAFKLKDIIGGSLIWETDKWHLRLTSLRLRIDNSLNDILGTKDLVTALEAAATIGWADAQQIAEDIVVDDNNIRYHSFGISFDHYPWIIDYELGYVDPDFELIKPYAGSYLSVGYRIAATTIYTLLSSANQTDPREKVSDIPPEILANPFIPEAQKTNLVLLQQGVQMFYDDSFFDQESASLGLRWNIRHDTALKVQWSHTWIEAAAATLWKRRNIPEEETEIDTYSISVDFIF